MLVTCAVPCALCAPHHGHATWGVGGCTATQRAPSGSHVIRGVRLHTSGKFSETREGWVPKKKKQKETEYEKVPAIPGPGAILKRDGTWLEPQPQGGYLLREGSATGAPPAELRKRMRGHMAEQMHVAIAILASDESSNRDKLSSLEFLAKYGLGLRNEKFDPELIKALALAVQAEIEDKTVLRRIEKRWAGVLKEHVVGT